MLPIKSIQDLLTSVKHGQQNLQDTVAAVELILESVDSQTLYNRERIAELTEVLLLERQAADELVEGLTEIHLGHVKGMGFKAKKRHLEGAIEDYEQARSEAHKKLAEPANARAKARLEQDRIAAEDKADEPEPVKLLADLVAEAQSGIDEDTDETELEPVRGDLDKLNRIKYGQDSIQILGLSKPAVRGLERAGIMIINHVLDCSPSELMEIRGFAEASMYTLLDSLNDLSIRWQGEAQDLVFYHSAPRDIKRWKEFVSALDLEDFYRKKAAKSQRAWYHRDKARREAK
tara:strand:- start:1231 stop:2100 length:870 start_codon:yes stop_codon:yes gene_type:complete